MDADKSCDGVQPWSLKPRRLRLQDVLAVGAGSLIAAVYIGTGDISIATSMGARFGYELLWTYYVLGLAGWALVDMSVRYFLRFGRTPMSIFKEVHWIFSAYMMITVIVTSIIGSYSQWNASALMLSSVGLPLEAAGVISAAAALAVLWRGIYMRLERILSLGLVALILSFLISALMAEARWGEALKGLIPHAPRAEGWQALLAANAGSIINAWLILIYPYTMMEKGWYSDDLQEKVNILRRVRIDYAWGMMAGGLVALFLMGAASAIARPFGIVPRTYTDFAALLEPLAGPFSTYIFLVGLFLAAWTSGIGWWVGGSYALLDIFNLRIDMGSKPMKTCLLLFFTPSALLLVLHINPFYQIIMFAAFLAFVTPVMGLALLYRISRRDMGYFRWCLRTPASSLMVLLDILAIALCVYVGWANISSLVGVGK